MATRNRLQLDFTLSSTEERTAFVQEYLSSIDFTPSQAELEKIGSYILWGKDSSGRNVRQTGEIELETRYKTWDSQSARETSLDALLEDPMFSEENFKKPEDPIYRTPKVKLDRPYIRATASPTYLNIFEDLWHRIDTIELLLNFYEISIGKRTKEPREELLRQFSDEEISAQRNRAETLSSYHYLKLRHQLVELRREQYTYKDLYAPLHECHGESHYSPPTTISFNVNVPILPLGLKGQTRGLEKIWQWPIQPNFQEEELEFLVREIWKEQPTESLYFDFRNVEHLYNAFLQLNDLKDAVATEESAESNLGAFVETLEFYAAAADLNESQRLIFELKVAHKQNSEIASIINSKYGTHYNENYISTIWRKKILEEIALIPTLQLEELKEVFYPENWKKCTRCGRLLRRDPRYFMRKKTSSDGLGSRCKKCEKEIRDSKKNKQEEK